MVLAGGAAAGDRWLAVEPDGTVAIQEMIPAPTPQVSVTRSDATGTILDIGVPGFRVATKESPEGEFLVLDWPDASVAGEIGEPALPVVRRLLVAAPGATAVAEAREGAAAMIDLDAQGLPWRVISRQPPIEKVPGAVERAVFQWNEAAYQQASPAGDRVTIERVGIFRGRQVFLLTVKPIHYDPVARTLTPGFCSSNNGPR